MKVLPLPSDALRSLTTTHLRASSRLFFDGVLGGGVGVLRRRLIVRERPPAVAPGLTDMGEADLSDEKRFCCGGNPCCCCCRGGDLGGAWWWRDGGGNPGAGRKLKEGDEVGGPCCHDDTF